MSGVRTLLSRAAVALAITAVLAACGKDSTGPDDGQQPVANVLAVSAGGAHSCALRTDGAAFCWGRNSSGQLGDGTVTDRLTPTAVTGGHTFRAISAGDTHTCAITQANRVYCWGDNVHGQVGGSGPAEIGVPPTLVSDMTFSSVSAGQDHSCGIATNLTAYCWGQALLGDGPTRTRRPTPVAVSGGPYNRISASVNFTCALTTAGAAMCWGAGAGGVLGNGSAEEQTLPTAVSGSRTFTSISAGIAHTCAVEATTSDAWCWGTNTVGQLGTGATSSGSMVPVKVTGDLDVATIDAGELHTCATAQTGTFCWGRNSVGQLGTGDLTQREAPALVVDVNVQETSAFRGHTCGLGVGNRAWCWGANAFGAVGTGGTSPRETRPVAVSLPVIPETR